MELGPVRETAGKSPAGLIHRYRNSAEKSGISFETIHFSEDAAILLEVTPTRQGIRHRILLLKKEIE